MKDARTTQILHVGEDNELLFLRTAVLQQHWFITSVHIQDAIAALRQSRFDLLLICHSVPDEARALIEDDVRGSSIPTLVLTLSRGLPSGKVLRTRLGLQISSDPASLVHSIEEVLRKSS